MKTLIKQGETMKKIILALAITLTSFTANAFQYHMNATWTPQKATVNVVNSYGRSIICSGNLVAQYGDGYSANAWMRGQFIPAGTHRFLFVNAINAYMNPIVYAQANINCEFARNQGMGGGFLY
jgi:hypothetical protein